MATRLVTGRAKSKDDVTSEPKQNQTKDITLSEAFRGGKRYSQASFQACGCLNSFSSQLDQTGSWKALQVVSDLLCSRIDVVLYLAPPLGGSASLSTK